MKKIGIILIVVLFYACKLHLNHGEHRIEEVNIFEWKRLETVNSGKLKAEFERIDSLHPTILLLEDSISTAILDFASNANISRHIPTKLDRDVLYGQLKLNGNWVKCVFLPTKIITLEGMEFTYKNNTNNIISETYRYAFLIINETISN